MSSQGRTSDARFPEKLRFLFEPARYKVAYGGRGGAKSWGVARALLIQGFERPLRILCAREFQNSISDSVHKLLADQIDALGLNAFYEVQKVAIKGANGTEIAFAGIRHNVAGLRSFEGVDRCWVEEAQTVSKASWETLSPTIRKEGSEIWITFNPELDSDETYQRFVARPPPGSVVVKVNWSDNPWLPQVLLDEKDALQARDPDAYLTVWEGHCRQSLDGAVYANEIRDATEQSRICRVPYDSSKPVHTFWDLGRSDMTAIWFVQIVGFETRVLDYYENSGFALDHYLKTLQTKPYVYGETWLPHDASHKLLGAAKTIEAQARDAGFKVRITPQIGVANGINAARTLFKNAWVDAEKCERGLQCLRHYQFKVDDVTGQRSREPLHNWASHGADAWRYMAVGLQERKPKSMEKQVSARSFSDPGIGWMAG